MSYDVAIWYAPSTPSPEEAAEVYDRLIDEHAGAVAVSASLRDFLDDLDAMYTDLTPDVSDEAAGASPWTAQVYRTAECAIMTISWSRRVEVVPVVLALAARHGLIAYDPQQQIVHAAAGASARGA